MSKVQLIIVRGLPGSGKSTIAKNAVTHVTSVGDTCVQLQERPQCSRNVIAMMKSNWEDF